VTTPAFASDGESEVPSWLAVAFTEFVNAFVAASASLRRALLIGEDHEDVRTSGHRTSLTARSQRHIIQIG
jgi:hypothetical protein